MELILVQPVEFMNDENEKCEWAEQNEELSRQMKYARTSTVVPDEPHDEDDELNNSFRLHRYSLAAFR